MSMTRDELTKYIDTRWDCKGEVDVFEKDCETFVFLMDNCQIIIPEENRFFVDVNCHHLAAELTWYRARVMKKEIMKGVHAHANDTLAYTGMLDISHTAPKWEDILELGFYGLKKRVEEYKNKYSKNDKTERFYNGVLKFYDGIDRFLERAAKLAKECNKSEMAKSLLNLRNRPPQNLYEAMQTSIAYYVFHHVFEGTYLRTMGRIDALFYPFWIKEDKEYAKKLIYDYFAEADRLKAPANIPFAFGGNDENGNSTVSELTYEIVDMYANSNLSNTKFHLLCADNTPDAIVSECFKAIQRGKNSIFFLSDSKVIESLIKNGADTSDAMKYHIVGCYEAGCEGELTCTSNGRISIPKALEFALNGGRDIITCYQTGLETDSHFETFEELFDEFERQFAYLCRQTMEVIDHYEAHYDKLHCAPLFSSTYPDTLKSGKDLYCERGAKYNNSSINAIGLATAVDSLAAIKKLVFDDKTMSLEKLAEILKSDWKGEEALRLTVKNKYPKYGIGDDETDQLAARVVDMMSSHISGKPNAKGGVYRLGLLTIDWRWEFGEKCGASADGRRRGETLSQNTSATFGAAREGATAHLASIARIDASKVPNGSIADIDLHISAVRGVAGSEALCAMLKTYFDLGGFGVHFNVLDTEILKKAKEDPSAYPDLQVRLCGWNVLFSTLSEKEKDEFIARSEI